MKILQDYQTFIRQKYGGISRYHMELTKNMRAMYDDVKIDIPIVFSRSYYLENQFKIKRWEYNHKLVQYASLLVNDAWTFIRVLVAAISGKPYDIIHLSWYKAYYARLLSPLCKRCGTKIVVTIHDLVHEMISDTNPVMRRGVRDRIKSLKIADEIIAISENTKKDLLHYYPELKNNKIHIIYHGFMQEKGKEEIGNEGAISEDTVLFVGNRKGYKNFETFANAMGQVKKILPQIKLVCAGGGKFEDAEQSLIERNGLAECTLQKYMSDVELVECYSRAKCFVFPSLYEGFGMPILEAFSYGCPTVLSDASCFPEIAGDAAIYFNGQNEESIAEQIVKVFCDENLRKNMIEKGYKRLKDFSWEKAAKETMDVYKGKGEKE